MSLLFSKFKLGNLTLANRTVFAPSCTYKVKNNDGKPNEYHQTHYGARAIGSVGLIIVEATAVESRGRITNNDLGLYNDEQISAHQNITRLVKSLGSQIGVQLAHAGRKSECTDSEAVAPSTQAFSPNSKIPKKLSLDEILQIKQNFVSAAIRAKKAGYDLVEIHAAHGYLLNQFLSKKINDRDDEYGKDKTLLLKQIITEIKNAVDIEVGVRLSAYTWQNDDYSVNDIVTLSKELEKLGICYLHISSGGVYFQTNDAPTIAPLYQAQYAKAIKQAVNIPVIAVGLIKTAGESEALLLGDVCDLVAYSRAILANPNFVIQMMSELKEYDLIDNTFTRTYK